MLFIKPYLSLIFVHLVFRFLSLLPINCIPLVCALSLLNKCPRARVYCAPGPATKTAIAIAGPADLTTIVCCLYYQYHNCSCFCMVLLVGIKNILFFSILFYVCLFMTFHHVELNIGFYLMYVCS